MFVDGLTYASLSRNLAEGQGHFWSPFYTATLYPVFYEQPPLGIWMQSLAFRLAGDSTAVEFVWGVGCGLVMIWLISLVWRDLLPIQVGSWWPVMVFLLFPLVSWILANNMLENTMACFALLGFWAVVRALAAPNRRVELAWAAGSGAAMALAMLTKGFPAAFLLAVPAAALFMRRTVASRAWRITLFLSLVGVSVIGFFLLCGGVEARVWADKYLSQQVFRSLSGQREVARSHFFLLGKLATELAVPFVLVALLHLATRRRRGRGGRVPVGPSRGVSGFLLVSAVLATFPLLVSPKQLGWYLYPGLSLWALAIAASFPSWAYFVESSLACREQATARLLRFSLLGSMAVLVATLCFHGSVTTRRPDLFRDLSALHQTPPAREIITVSPAGLVNDWYLVAYMQRMFRVSLTASRGRPFLLLDLSDPATAVPPGWLMANRSPPRRYWLGTATHSLQ